MRGRRWRWAVSLASLMIVGWVVHANAPTLSGPTKGDEATFASMTLSLVQDGDLKFTKTDLDRFRATFGIGPEGLFVKRGYQTHVRWQTRWPPVVIDRTPVPVEQSLEYGKAFLYAVVATPFVMLFGLSGFWILNLLLLGVATACAVAFARARAGAVTGTVIGVSFLLVTVVPVYVVWLTPELLNLTLVCVGYFLWLYKEVAPVGSADRWRAPWTDWAAALLIGLATFSKPPNAPLIAPLVCYALWRGQWKRSATLVALFVIGSGGSFGANALISGEWNYQGGDRKSFYSHFPYESDASTFDSLGNAMATNDTEAESLLSPATALPRLRHNAVYFLLGQNAGLLPYYFPGALIGIAFLWRWRQAAVWQWLAFAACAGAALILLVLTPYSWSGGGGPVGNRYYLSIYPVLLFLLPEGTRVASACLGALAGAVCMAPVLVRPVEASLEPWTIGEQWPLRYLPVELTLLDDSPVRLNPARGRIPFWIESFVFMYYMDGNSYSPEPAGGVAGAPTDGFWIAGDRTARIALRSDRPLTRVEFTIRTRQPNVFTFDLGGRSGQVALDAGQGATVQLSPENPVRVGHSYAYMLTMSTTAGFVPADEDAAAGDTRNLGVFIKPVFRDRPYGER